MSFVSNLQREDCPPVQTYALADAKAGHWATVLLYSKTRAVVTSAVVFKYVPKGETLQLECGIDASGPSLTNEHGDVFFPCRKIVPINNSTTLTSIRVVSSTVPGTGLICPVPLVHNMSFAQLLKAKALLSRFPTSQVIRDISKRRITTVPSPSLHDYSVLQFQGISGTSPFELFLYLPLGNRQGYIVVKKKGCVTEVRLTIDLSQASWEYLSSNTNLNGSFFLPHWHGTLKKENEDFVLLLTTLVVRKGTTDMQFACIRLDLLVPKTDAFEFKCSECGSIVDAHKQLCADTECGKYSAFCETVENPEAHKSAWEERKTEIGNVVQKEIAFMQRWRLKTIHCTTTTTLCYNYSSKSPASLAVKAVDSVKYTVRVGTTLWDVELSELGYIQHCGEGVAQCAGFPYAFSPFLNDCNFAFCVGEDVWLINGKDESVAMTWAGVVRTRAYVQRLEMLRDKLIAEEPFAFEEEAEDANPEEVESIIRLGAMKHVQLYAGLSPGDILLTWFDRFGKRRSRVLFANGST